MDITANMLDRSKETKGKIIGIDGSLSVLSYMSVSDYIDTNGFTKFICKWQGESDKADTLFRLGCYDNNKSFISRTSFGSEADKTKVIDLPAGTKYIMMSYISAYTIYLGAYNFLEKTYKDEITPGRKYNMTTNADGTVSFTRADTPSQVGDFIDAEYINNISNIIKDIIRSSVKVSDLITINAANTTVNTGETTLITKSGLAKGCYAISAKARLTATEANNGFYLNYYANDDYIAGIKRSGVGGGTGEEPTSLVNLTDDSNTLKLAVYSSFNDAVTLTDIVLKIKKIG